MDPLYECKLQKNRERMAELEHQLAESVAYTKSLYVDRVEELEAELQQARKRIAQLEAELFAQRFGSANVRIHWDDERDRLKAEVKALRGKGSRDRLEAEVKVLREVLGDALIALLESSQVSLYTLQKPGMMHGLNVRARRAYDAIRAAMSAALAQGEKEPKA